MEGSYFKSFEGCDLKHYEGWDGIGLGKYSEGWDDFLPKEEGCNV